MFLKSNGELLVLLSSCVFVVTAILAAVLSVTNSIFQPLPSNYHQVMNIFCPSSYLITTISLLDSYKLNKSLSEVGNAFLCCCISSFYTTDDLFLNTSSKALNGYEQFLFPMLKVLRTLSYSDDHNFTLGDLLSAYSLMQYTKRNTFQVDKKTSYTYEGFYTLRNIDSIKESLLSSNDPVIMSLSDMMFVDTSFSTQTNSGEFLSIGEFIDSDVHTYLIVGWNDWYTIRYSMRPDLSSTGGFIAMVLYENSRGHTLDYLIGRKSSSEEDYLCGSSPPVQNTTFICNNTEYCNVSEEYIALPDYGSDFEYFIHTSTKQIKAFPLGASFNIFQSQSTENYDCKYVFIPYSLIEQRFQKSINYVKSEALYLFLNISWNRSVTTANIK